MPTFKEARVIFKALLIFVKVIPISNMVTKWVSSSILGHIYNIRVTYFFNPLIQASRTTNMIKIIWL